MDTPFLTNRKLTDEEVKKIISMGDENEPILFAVCGDISTEAKYSSCVLLATKSKIFSYDFGKGETSEMYAFSDIESIYNKRMYGNGVMRLVLKNGERHDLVRFTFTVAALCDAVVIFAKDVGGGMPVEEAYSVMEAVYEKMLSVCPKCGRTLSAPGVPCVHCMSKRRLLKKLGGYLKPESPILIISVIISVITTGITLLPPLLTKSLVDEILPGHDFGALGAIVVLLICVHIIHYLLSGLRGYMLRVSGNKIIAKLRCDVYEKAQYLPMRFYDKTSTGSVINRISNDTANLQAFMLRITQEVVVQFF